MTCPHCRAILTRLTAGGDGVIRTRGIIVKASGTALLCPRCRRAVPVNLEVLRIMPLVVFRAERSEPR